MITRALTIASLLFVVAACTRPVTSDNVQRLHREFRIEHRVSDSGYEEKRLKWRGEFEGRTSRVFVKRFREDGMLVMCGFRVYATGLADRLEELWFAGARIVIDGVEVTKTKYLLTQAAKYAKEAEVAACVNTGWPATDALMKKPIGFDGDPVRGSVGRT